MFLVRNSLDPDVPWYVLTNLRTSPSTAIQTMYPVQEEAMRSLIKLSFHSPMPGTQAEAFRAYLEKTTYSGGMVIGSKRTLQETVFEREKRKLQTTFITQQIQSGINLQNKQQEQMETAWRDVMKMEDETVVRRINDLNPMVCLLALQAAAKRRLPVEKEAIALLGH